MLCVKDPEHIVSAAIAHHDAFSKTIHNAQATNVRPVVPIHRPSKHVIRRQTIALMRIDILRTIIMGNDNIPLRDELLLAHVKPQSGCFLFREKIVTHNHEHKREKFRQHTSYIIPLCFSNSASLAIPSWSSTITEFPQCVTSVDVVSSVVNISIDQTQLNRQKKGDGFLHPQSSALKAPPISAGNRHNRKDIQRKRVFPFVSYQMLGRITFGVNFFFRNQRSFSARPSSTSNISLQNARKREKTIHHKSSTYVTLVLPRCPRGVRVSFSCAYLYYSMYIIVRNVILCTVRVGGY